MFFSRPCRNDAGNRRAFGTWFRDAANTVLQRSSLFFSVCLVLVFGCGAGYSIISDYKATIASGFNLVRDVARLAEGHIHNTIRRADRTLGLMLAMVQDSPDLQAVATRPDFERLRDYVTLADGCRSLWIFDANGNVVLESVEFPPRKVNVRDRGYFQSAQAGEPFFIGPAAQGKLAQTIFFPVSRPLRDSSGQLLGIVQASLDVEWLTNFYELMDFNLSPVVQVARLDGALLACRPDILQCLDAKLDDPEFVKLTTNPGINAIDAFITVNGVERLAAYRQFRQYDLVTVASIEKDVLLSDWRARSAVMIIGACLSVVLIQGAVVLTLGSRRRASLARLELNHAQHEIEASAVRLNVARHDHLTGIPSRGLWLELAQAAIDNSHEADAHIAVMIVDLDNFKNVNDNHGHEIGDEVLRRAAAILGQSVRETDLIGRLGGDEFVLFAQGSADVLRVHAAAICGRVIRQMETVGYGVGCSIGAAFALLKNADLHEILRQADIALYEAKHLGKRQFVCRGPAQTSRTPENHPLSG